MNQQVLVFTDLDGSLLDHFSYSHAAADKLLAKLQQARIPVIPCTSKTRTELVQIRDELQNPHPFITENGAAVYIPDNYFTSAASDCSFHNGFWIKHFCQPRAHWLQVIDSVKDDFAGLFTGFAESTVQEIAAMTGLTLAEAEAASCREFGEPIQWHGDNKHKQDFINALESAGASVLQGGRFLHVTGNTDKGRALDWLTGQYARQTESKPCYSIAIGDSGNDKAMLEIANQALIIRSPVHPPPALQRTTGVEITDQYGPQGWAAGLDRILKNIGINLNNSFLKR